MDLTGASLVDFAQQQPPQQQEEEVLVPHQELPNGAQPMEGPLPSPRLAFLLRLVILLGCLLYQTDLCWAELISFPVS
jgi:hypothetical protein